MGDEPYVWSSFGGAKFRIIYYKQFLNKRRGIGKKCRSVDDYIWEGVCVVCVVGFVRYSF